MSNPLPAIAVIDGRLCRLSRNGRVAAAHEPLATAVLEFKPAAERIYVREHPYGLLRGVPNVYCLDEKFRLQWLAEWPLADDPCGRLVDEVDGVLITESTAGVVVRLDAITGRAVSHLAAVAAAS